MRSRIDWKYLLGLELADAGFDYSVLSGFRTRLVAGAKQTLLLERLLERFRQKKLLKVRGNQRTDPTHVLAAIRVMNRLELVTETMRAALNELAAAAPDWLAEVALPEWLTRYAVRAEQSRMPHTDKAREAFSAQVGEDGFDLLKLLAAEQPDLLKLEKVAILERVWQRHYTRREDGEVQWRPAFELGKAATAIESPYDAEARFSTKRDLSWLGYKVHLSETCDEHLPRLIINVLTTAAMVQDVSCTDEIQSSMAKNNLLPARHLIDTGYIDAQLVFESARRYGIELFGPMRINSSWQARTGGIDASQFEIDWDQRRASCPAGKQSAYWSEYQTKEYASPVVKISQGVRRGTLRQSRYRGLAKTHLQEVATAAAINIVRAVNFLDRKPIEKTRVSRFARLGN